MKHRFKRHVRKNTNFLESASYAAEGIRYVIIHERNMRFHITVGNLICFFAYFYGLDRAEWAVLLLTIFFVIAGECFNTAIEKAVDTATEAYSRNAKFAKDAAAAATLVCAVCAVAVGIALFADAGKIASALEDIFTNGVPAAAAVLLFGADVFFLIFVKDKKSRGKKAFHGKEK